MWVLSVDGRSAVSLLTAVTVMLRQSKHNDPNSWSVVAVPPVNGIEVVIIDGTMTEETARAVMLSIVSRTGEGSFQV